MLIKAKGLFPNKLKTIIKKFKKFNGYNDLDKKMLKYLNYKNGFFLILELMMELISLPLGILRNI